MVTIAAMTLALCFELLYAGMLPGYLRSMEEDVVEMEVGDIQIHALGYIDNPTIYTQITDVEGVLRRLEEAGYPASPRVLAGGLAAAGKYASGVVFRGIDVPRDAEVSRVHERLASGNWLDPADAHGVVVGRTLAETLDVGSGSEIVVLSQAADGSMANDLYIVRGVLASVEENTDRAAVFMNLNALRELLVIPDGVHQVVVRRPADVDLDTAAAIVAALAPGLDTRDWRQIMPVIASMLESTQGAIYIIFFVIYIAVAILILNAMLMAVFERIREFGVLKALGVGPRLLMSLLLAESGIQTGLAVLLGVAFALPGMWYLSEVGINVGALGGTAAMGVVMRQVWYGIYDVGTVQGPVIMLVVIVFLATLYPAFKAAYMSPAEAMRHR
ncbi:MAG: FtsX-like permease family protein [Nannocystaceae bacterium]